ncbi:hypothetical protein AVEN_49819-1 [Araneus ventricosus]|uniref:Helitron helicase-like domain-containing protein n=1 Tax=Araneus ventricosus TaxID=182803 RepID=A0A4Y2JNZ6_ARAVE|nr:hypothetical protein AVEN_49819-1 [Araneus ventricosus]
MSTKKISAMDDYAISRMFRKTNLNIILRCMEILYQFVVDMHAKIESERLRFLRLNQKKLRVENYIRLRDAINSGGTLNELGITPIFQSSFTGSPRANSGRIDIC